MFKPKQQDLPINNEQTIKNSHIKNDFNPTTFKIIKNETKTRIVSLLFWLSVLTVCLIGIGYNALTHLNTESLGIGLYILISIPGFISLFYITKNTIKILQWKKINKKYKDNFSSNDISSSPVFAELYRSLILKRLRITWLIIFFFTYFGLFNILIFSLKDQIIEIGSPFSPQENTSFNIHFILDFKQVFNQWFKNTNLLLIINLSIMISALAFYIFSLFFDKKRADDIINNFNSNEAAVQLQNVVYEQKTQENKIWIKSYVIIFVLTILLPFVLVIYLVYRGIVRRKK